MGNIIQPITQIKKHFEGNDTALKLLYQKRTQANILSFHLENPEKVKMKPKASRRKEIKIRVEVNERETRKTRNINQIKSYFFAAST